MNKIRFVPIMITIMLLIALGFTSTAAYAYWTDISHLSNVVITFEPEDANLIIEDKHVNLSGVLVPRGYIYLAGEVDQLVYSYDVSVDKTLVQSLNLVIDAIDVKIDGLEEYEHLVDIQIGSGDRHYVNLLYNSKITITIVVRLLEPIDAAEAVKRGFGVERINVTDSKAAYNAIKGKDISFTIRFNVEPRT